MGKVVKKHTRRQRVTARRDIPDEAREAERRDRQLIRDLWLKSRYEWLTGVRPMQPWPPTIPPTKQEQEQEPKQKQKGDGRQVSRVRGMLKRVYPPDGCVPDSHTDKEVRQRLAPLFEQAGWALPGRDSIARARGRRRK